MKYIKKLKNYIEELEKGDYVKLNYITDNQDVNNFFDTNIGKVDDVFGYNPLLFAVKFEYVPDNISERFIKYRNHYIYHVSFNSEDLVAYAKTKEELELEIATNKFNI